MLHGDVELVALGVVDDEVLAVVVLARGATCAGEPAHAVLDVHDVVPGVELGQERVAAARSSAGCRTTLGGAEYLGVAQDDETATTYAEGQPLAEAGAGVLEDGDRSGTGGLLKGIEERGLHAAAVEELAEPLGDGAYCDESVAFLGGVLGLNDEGLDVAAVFGA